MADDGSAHVRFGVLGPLEAWRGDSKLHLGSPQQRTLLAVLLRHAGQPVAMSDLIQAVWPDEAPNTAANLIHRYVGQLRRLIEPGLPNRAEGRWLTRAGTTYRMQVDVNSLDLLRFRDLARQAREQKSRRAAVGLYAQALALWRGCCGTAYTTVDEEILAIVVEAADTALACGEVQDILKAVRRIAPSDPLNEPLHTRLMLLLAAAGEYDGAVAVYKRLAEQLAEELGVDPGQGATAAYQQVLHQRENGPAVSPSATVPPAHLPRDLQAFSGRTADLSRIMHAVRSADRTTSVALIDGMPGVGKTTTAVHLAHELADHYPDGQLFVNLRGFDPAMVATDPADALRYFLRALGVTDSQLPASVDSLAGLYRSLLAGKRVLVVLDNARDAEQVSPLIPGSSSCLTIVTSRSRLTSLIATAGAYPFTLDPMPVEDARAMVLGRLGDQRGEQEPEAVGQIVAMCGRLPLALAVAAGRAAMFPDVPLHAIVRDLASAGDSLEAFSRDEAVDIRAVFNGSYRRLSPDAARMFRLLALHWGPDISKAVCPSMAGMPARAARAALGELSRTRLLIEHAPDRFEFHDLVRVYAVELCFELESPADRNAAIRRMLDHYLLSARNMALIQAVGIDVQLSEPPAPGVTPEPQPDSVDTKLAWFASEQQVLENAVRRAADAGFAEHGWQLALALQPYYQREGLYIARVSTAQAGYQAAEATGDKAGQVLTMHSLAGAEYQAGDSERSLRHLTTAEELADELGWLAEKANILRHMGSVVSAQGHLDSGDYPKAYQYYEQAAQLYRSLDEPRGLAAVLGGMGNCLVEMGQPEQGFALHQEAIETYSGTGDINGEAVIWSDSSVYHHKVGDYATAVSHATIALALHRRMHHQVGQVVCLIGIAEAYKDLGQPDRARANLQEALNLMTPDRVPTGGWPKSVSVDKIKEWMASLE
ncbi:tetratricopeptide repeat protein [Kibdelosporangium philippinense]|uniref:Tetratricopeptide repeat protein n=1 Tax=Kibdelosporangium philippinense TaxID=211113 RepID=A0ABS8Z6I5_9PSEU|nr:tetratricopeptide repeat protein [Kibdelosporangium philippinense]MCE7003107.1 tetratricopeptide repeat protein [Kibdelosporangium philippinense]